MLEKDFKKYLEEEDDRLKKQFGLEAIIKQALWDGQVANRNFNRLMNYVVGMMKKCVENEDYKKQLYMIKNGEWEKEEKSTELETGLVNALEEAEIDEDEFEETFSCLINFTKRCVENNGYKKQLYEINPDDYKSEKEQ